MNNNKTIDIQQKSALNNYPSALTESSTNEPSKSTAILTGNTINRAKPTKKVQRSKIPPSHHNNCSSIIIPETLKTKKKLIDLTKIGLSANAGLLLQKVALTLPKSGSFPIIDNLVYYAHTHFEQLSKNILNCDEIEEVFAITKDQLYLSFYTVLSNAVIPFANEKGHFTEYLKWKKYFPLIDEQIDALYLNIDGLKSCYNLRSCKSRVSQKCISNAKIEANRLIDEITETFVCIKEIFNLPNEIFFKLADNKISNLAQWKIPDTDNLSSKEELCSFYECICLILESTKKMGLACVSCPVEKHRSICSEITKKSLNNNSNDEDVFYQKSVLIDQYNNLRKNILTETKNNFLNASKGNITHEGYLKAFNMSATQYKTQDEFTSNLLFTYIFNYTIDESINYIIRAFNSDIREKVVILNIEHLLRLDIITKKLIEFPNEGNFLLGAAPHIETISKILSPLLNKNIFKHFNDFIDKIKCLQDMLYPNNLKIWEFGKEGPQNSITERQGTSENKNSEATPTTPKTNSSGLGITLNSHLIDILNDLSKPSEFYEFIKYKGAKNAFKDFNKEVFACQKLMVSCSKELQKAINGLTLSNDVIEILENAFTNLKSEISPYLCTLFELPNTFNNLFTIKTNAFSNKNAHVIEIDLDNSEIPNLFNISFKKLYEKQPSSVKISEPPIEVQDVPLYSEKTVFAIPKESFTKEKCLTKPLQPYEQGIPKNVHEIKHQEEPFQSTKLGKLIDYLTKKGWTIRSTRGSHVKFELQNQTLIVPINKPHLKRGTLHAILSQESEKLGESPTKK